MAEARWVEGGLSQGLALPPPGSSCTAQPCRWAIHEHPKATGELFSYQKAESELSQVGFLVLLPGRTVVREAHSISLVICLSLNPGDFSPAPSPRALLAEQLPPPAKPSFPPSEPASHLAPWTWAGETGH